MRLVLLVTLALPFAPVAVPTAAACDGDNPCDPPPMPMCPSHPKSAGELRTWVVCWRDEVLT